MKRVIVLVSIAAAFWVAGSSSATAAHCAVQSVGEPLAGALVRGSVAVAWQAHPHCATTSTFTVSVSNGTPTVLTTTGSINSSRQGSISWDTASFADGGPYTISVTPTAGGAGVSVGSIAVDNTAPVTALVSRTAANGNGWNSGPVAVEWSCIDATSSVVSPTITQTLSSDGAGQTATATCQDAAGNTSSDTQTEINIDSVAPSIAFDSVTAPNGSGWNNTAVTATWNCADALSGVASTQVSDVLDADGAGQTANGTCADLAGNAASASVSGINIDTTAPAIAPLSLPEPNENGWYVGDVLIVWSCSDAGSGPIAEQVSATLSGSGADRSATQTCEDLAGNDSAPDTASGIDIDADAPTIELASRTPANAAGWNNTVVEVVWNCTDQEGLSGPATATKSATLADEGADQSASATCMDLAGNESATDTVDNIDIDRTDPAIALVSRTAANGAGWNNTDVTLVWSCTDGLSGVLEGSLNETLADEGADQSASATCDDVAGNSSEDTQGNIDIDKTAATTTIASAEIGPSLSLLGAAVTGSRADNLSGIAVTQVVFTNVLLGQQETRTAVCVSGCDTLDQQWEVSTAGLTPGAYTVTASTDDIAGNDGASTAPITVIVTG